MLPAALLELLKYVNTEALAILANLAQHVKQSENSTEELLRLLRILDKELKPRFRIGASKKEEKGNG